MYISMACKCYIGTQVSVANFTTQARPQFTRPPPLLLYMTSGSRPIQIAAPLQTSWAVVVVVVIVSKRIYQAKMMAMLSSESVWLAGKPMKLIAIGVVRVESNNLGKRAFESFRSQPG